MRRRRSDRRRRGAAWAWASRSCAASPTCSATRSRSSRATGAGSRFRVLLPRVAARRAAAPARAATVCDDAVRDVRSVRRTRWSRSSTTMRRRSTRCARCSKRGARSSSAATTPDALLASIGRARTLSGPRSSPTCGLPTTARASTPSRRLRDELGFAIPAIIVSGDTGTRADREARAAGLTLLPKPVVGATLRAAAIAALQRATCALDRVA